MQSERNARKTPGVGRNGKAPPHPPFSAENQPLPENRSGGPNPITNAIKRALAKVVDKKTRRTMLDDYGEALVVQAMGGNAECVRQVNGRIDGPLPERVAGDPPVDLSGWSLADKKALRDLIARNAAAADTGPA